MANFTSVFLSSTAKDLQPFRDAVSDGIMKTDTFHTVRMENFGARDATAQEVCRAKVRESDVFVGLVGHLYGNTPAGSNLSYTEMEYEDAKKAGKPRLMFLAADDLPLPSNLRETDEAWQRQQRFRDRVKTERLVVFFREPSMLATSVVIALQRHQSDELRATFQKTTARGGRAVAGRGESAALRRTETLYRDYLAERYRYLDLRGMGISDRVPLRLELVDMYVPLKARVQAPLGETWERSAARLAGRRVTAQDTKALVRQWLLASYELRPRGYKLSVLDLLRKASCLVLLGDPGSGKTTFLKFLALELIEGRGESLGLGKRLPVLLPLSTYASALTNQDLSLGRFLPRYFEKRGFDLPLASLLKKKLAGGELLLLLDGLDEVWELDRRKLLIDRVQDFLASTVRRVTGSCSPAGSWVIERYGRRQRAW